ncbi:cupin-like domain-containing protein [Ponticaulis sp.]|uniref:cupin-like domain-containing protein n=1 Tax=Ponticaulis sp. TaxID=2020902 RepID=UPI0026283E6B|nr:cupin-like domain-containing protein [Ponticaulis sp.]MDF1679071.1 cupin-like domain-containing protein [Ponticaulis sp.]
MSSEVLSLEDVVPLKEVQATSFEELRPHMAENRPFVVRGLVKDWPLVQAGLQSGKAAREYLLTKARDVPFVVNIGSPEHDGRMFYQHDMSMNTQMGKARLPLVFERIDRVEADDAQQIVYMSSVDIHQFFDGLHEENHVDFGAIKPLESIWIGTKTRVAPHNDFPDNIACVAVGRRRFTLFPPEQFRNLYIGPIDNTPAGRAISMVDLHDPDFETYPRYKEALAAAQTAVLEPGDAIFIPSMWWHEVDGLSPFNAMINYWWRETPQYLGAPQNALNHAIMAIRDLPEDERRHWRDLFDYYVFENGPDVREHIPEHGRGILDPMTPESAGKIRNFLLRMLTNE